MTKGIKGFQNLLKKLVRCYTRNKILKIVPKDSVCAEIGIWKGDYSKRILNKTNPKKLYLIDPWVFNKEYKDAVYGGTIAKSQKDMDNIYDFVAKRFKDEIRQGQVELHRNTFEELELPNNYFDWVYIDGDHSYDAVRKDLANAVKKVKEGGFIIGDDYIIGGWWDGGVKKAFDEFIRENPKKEVRIMGNHFVIIN